MPILILSPVQIIMSHPLEEEKLSLTNNFKTPGSAVQKSNDNKRYVYHLYRYPKKSYQYLKMILTNLMEKIQECVKK